MKTTIRYIVIITALFITFFPMGVYGEESDKDMFDRARLAYLDEKYDQALNQLDRLIEEFPDSDYYPRVLFYKGKCYEKKKMPQRALENFLECLVVSKDEFLKEQADVSIIDNNFTLYEKTDNKKHLDEIVRYLKSKNEVVRLYAAIVLSKAKDKASANKAVPILKKAVAEESDQDLVDRVKLALLRIDPKHLKQPQRPGSLVFQSVNKKTKIETFILKIPFSLTQLAMDSLPEDAKEALKEKGYDLDEIINTVVQKGQILKIESKDSIFRIWIE
ncbi:MAG: tetratricopeptide repeat protein [Candidatus Aminicenantes bacterium]|jgi:tetratricopeptide (TPR) repeat protein